MLTNIDEVKIFGAYAALPSPSLRVCSEIIRVTKMKTHGAHLKGVSVLMKPRICIRAIIFQLKQLPRAHSYRALTQHNFDFLNI